MSGKKKRSSPKNCFRCQIKDDYTILVERGSGKIPKITSKALRGFNINLSSTKLVEIDLMTYYRLAEYVRGDPGTVAQLIPKRALKLVTSTGFKTRGGDRIDFIKGFNWDRIPIKIREAAFPFQKDGIQRGIEQYCGRVLIADDMGLGKTIQGIGIVSYYKHNWPCLILCPSFLKLNWKKEFLRWTDIEEQSITVVKNGKQAIPKDAKIVILSYGLVSNIIGQLTAMNFKAIVADEAHYLKNRKAARTKNTIGLFHSAKTCILLTGTPMANRPEECFTLLSSLRPCYVGKWTEFVLRYCDAKQGLFGFDVTGKSNTRELAYLMRKSCMIRRLKQNVLKDLPPKLRSQITVQLTPKEMKPMLPIMQRIEIINKSIYSLPPASEECRKMSFERKSLICKLFHMNDTAKGKVVGEILIDLLVGVNKIVVFCYHMSMMDALEKKMRDKHIRFMRIDGKTPIDKREQYVTSFQSETSPYRVALLSLGAANSGITLTAAHTMLFASLHWVPSEICQAEDRCHRIGQPNAVDIRYVIAQDTIDEKMFRKINQKMEITSSILNSSAEPSNFNGTAVAFERNLDELSTPDTDSQIHTTQNDTNQSLCMFDAINSLTTI
jgi:SWI/SNF-related matrix-associated actin-dependent regulator 1 of chromatin subfamily A|tara:strand:+ start:1804 stop:3630 length:1827 start_codon:yes stop_codon:yes gene_type:complete